MRINIENNDSESITQRSDSQIQEINNSIDQLSNAADSVYLRQSAYSLLSEAMACGGWTAGKYLRDVLDIAIGTLQLERNNTIQEDTIMRRSSIFLIKYLLEGMKEKLFIIADGGNYLKDIYRILKIVTKDRDKVIVFQAERGL
eukprot:CAMPEP_0174824052 /NCGR_PEP_ID=MMETSP1107-20130205/30152_1 /TAXON_ID=36770 /ORGANISM="Paraphysomonas vestita, Strain GFlagA" /LENGTH=143 /DNA_ID=CAMNT_0016049279 /DNA_START=521 /DNA_END=949 /DNA_ORIENTATION=-